MSKIVKKVGKAVKSVVKGVKKVFNEITSSKLGKALLIGATIAMGGAAMGMWNLPGWVPFSGKINGAFVGGGASGTGASTVAAGGDVAGATVAGAESATATQQLGSMVGAESATFGGGAATGAATVPASALPTTAAEMGVTAGQGSAYTTNGAKWNSLVNEAVGGTVNGTASASVPSNTWGVTTGGTAGGSSAAGGFRGLIGKAGETAGKVGKFVNDNPVPSMMMMNAAASMASPDEYDILEKQRQLEQQERERREKNYDVAGIDLGIAPTPRRFTWQDGTPVFENGLINRGTS